MKLLKQLFCRHKDLYFAYCKNLSTETATTTVVVNVYMCKRCGKILEMPEVINE